MTIQENNERKAFDHGRRVANERRRDYWQAKAEQEIGERRRQARREADRALADNAAIAAWLAKFHASR